MFQRVNIFKIISDHLRTLNRIDSEHRSISVADFILFIFSPLCVAALLTFYDVSLSNHITDLITAVSIIGGFLLNLLAIIYGLMDKLRADAQTDEIKAILVKQVHVNISFNILVSLFLLIGLLIYPYIESAKHIISIPVRYFLTGYIYFLLLLFFLTMLMVLNRIYILLKKD